MMHRLPTTAVVGMLALTGGCSWGESNNNSNSGVVQSRVKLPSKTVHQPALKNLLKSLAILQDSPARLSSNSTGLIKSTDPSLQMKQVPQGRQDPFVPLFTIPPEIVAKPQIAVTKLALPTAQELPPAPPLAQALPSPDLARGVAVQGIIETSNGLHAIVQLPDEATSRYVSVGQRLSNGQILIKKINLNSDSEPSVIIEQHGVEVASSVGYEPAGLSDKKQATAAIPASPLVASEQSEEVALEPPTKPQAAVIKFGSYPKMSSNLPRRYSLLAAKKSLPARNHTDVVQTSSASVDISSLPSNLPVPLEESVAGGSEATELNSQTARYKDLISKLRKSSSSSVTSQVVETNTTKARYKELISRLDKPSKLSNNSPATKLNTQAAHYKDLISKLRKSSSSSNSSSAGKIDEQAVRYKEVLSRLLKQS